MDRRIEVVVSNLESRISKPWEIGELAHMVNLSGSRLRHLFKQETGKTPAQYLKHLRLEKAENSSAGLARPKRLSNPGIQILSLTAHLTFGVRLCCIPHSNTITNCLLQRINPVQVTGRIRRHSIGTRRS